MNVRWLTTLERRIGQAEGAGLRARWEFGRELLAARDGKGRLPNGYLVKVSETIGASQSEIKYRMQFAERFPTEEELANALASSWREIVLEVLPQRGTVDRPPPELPTGTYATVCADPPWDYSMDKRATFAERGGDRLRIAQPYPAMTVAEIAALDVGALAAPDSHLYLWTTRRYLRAAFDVLVAWRFAYVATLVWAKAPRGFMLGGTYGATAEFVLFARRGDLPALSTVNRDVFDWPRPGNEHSVKPDGFYEMVERVSPGPRIDLFARRQRDGWAAWGDEVAA